MLLGGVMSLALTLWHLLGQCLRWSWSLTLTLILTSRLLTHLTPWCSSTSVVLGQGYIISCCEIGLSLGVVLWAVLLAEGVCPLHRKHNEWVGRKLAGIAGLSDITRSIMSCVVVTMCCMTISLIVVLHRQQKFAHFVCLSRCCEHKTFGCRSIKIKVCNTNIVGTIVAPTVAGIVASVRFNRYSALDRGRSGARVLPATSYSSQQSYRIMCQSFF